MEFMEFFRVFFFCVLSELSDQRHYYHFGKKKGFIVIELLTLWLDLDELHTHTR